MPTVTNRRLRDTFDPLEITLRLDTLAEAKVLFALLRSAQAGEFTEIALRDSLLAGADPQAVAQTINDTFQPIKQALLDAYRETNPTP